MYLPLTCQGPGPQLCLAMLVAMHEVIGNTSIIRLIDFFLNSFQTLPMPEFGFNWRDMK